MKAFLYIYEIPCDAPPTDGFIIPTFEFIFTSCFLFPFCAKLLTATLQVGTSTLAMLRLNSEQEMKQSSNNIGGTVIKKRKADLFPLQ